MILAILLTLAVGQQHREPSCVEVKAYVWLHGEKAAEAYARRHGATKADVERIRRRCLREG